MVYQNKKNILFDIYTFSLVLLFLKTFSFKFFWNIPTSIFLVFNIVCYFLYFINSKGYNLTYIFFAFLFSVIVILQVFSNSLDGGVGQILNIIAVFCFLIISDECKIHFFNILIKVYTSILVISLVGWILVYILKVDLSYSIVEFQHYKFYDYFFFNTRVEGISFTRYLGMFIEPGYTGVMNVLLLVGNNFDMKKTVNKLLLLCTVFTLSLAAYLLLFIYLFFQIPRSKKIRFFFITTFIVLFVIYLIFSSNDEFILNRFLFNRIEDMLSGNITGNRFSDKFSVLYDSYINSNNIFLGVGSEVYNTFKLNSCGYKVYIFQYGMINTVLIILFYFFLAIKYYNRNVIIFFVVWFASFIDLGYATWLCFIFAYFASVPNIFYYNRRI